MKPKVLLRSIALPLTVSYLAGLGLLMATVWFATSLGEQFHVLDATGKPGVLTTSSFVGLGVYVCLLAFMVSSFSLIVKRKVVISVVALSVIGMLGLTFTVGNGVAFIWLGFIIGNIALFRGKSRLYVLALGISLFVGQVYNIFSRTSDGKTAAWLVAIDIVFSAPIFYTIFKFIPKQNKVD